MSHIDPAVWTQLIVAVTTLLGVAASILKSWSNGKKLDHNTEVTKTSAQVTADKIDQNTALTQQIVQSTGAFPTYVKTEPKDEPHA